MSADELRCVADADIAAVLSASPAVLRAVEDGTISLSMGARLSKLPRRRQQHEIRTLRDIAEAKPAEATPRQRAIFHVNELAEKLRELFQPDEPSLQATARLKLENCLAGMIDVLRVGNG
jgi:hypothetical protein